MDFLLNDKPYAVALQPTMIKILDYVKGMPDSKLFDSPKLSGILRIPISTFQHYSNNKLLIPYKYKVGKSMYWGNVKTIKAFKEYNEQEAK